MATFAPWIRLYKLYSNSGSCSNWNIRRRKKPSNARPSNEDWRDW